MNEPVLNQDEVDALLKDVNSVAGQAEPNADASVVRSFKLGNEMRAVRGRMPALELVNERLVSLLQPGICSMLRRNTEVSVEPVQLMMFNEYLQSLQLPTSLNLVKFNPLRGTGLVVFDPKLVFSVVDNVFGGNGRHAKIEGREFTRTETRIVRAMLEMVFSSLKEAWQQLQPLTPEHLGVEVNPHFANIVTPSESVVISRFKVDMDGLGGELHVVMPYSMLEPLREVLEADVQSDRPDRDERWANALHDEIMDATMDLRAVLGEGRLQVSEFSELKAGDIVPLEFSGLATLMSDGVPMFVGRYGASRGQCAVQLQRNARMPRAPGPSALSLLNASAKRQGA